ncbi:MAG: phosphodiester glycosidase family protein [Candidatus Marinimicrobia bacterium]|nr:phosphodiester glycosidase family protein [Candidatus Neomarinimicrobiota bacterium]MCF7921075.1 phosphodiester glycosidase family protein [Candidatus Neomarinimicrobiota bacterium]
MRKTALLMMIIALSFVSIEAQTLSSRPVGPGIVHHHAFLPGGPWHLQILEIDLSDTMNTLETIKAGNNIAGYERTSSMAARSSAPGHTVIGAINADFYASGGISIGSQIINGTLLKRPHIRSVFALTDNKQPFIDVVTFSGQISKGDSLSIDINGVNEVRNTDMLVLYNRYMGASTGTNEWGSEITVEYVNSPHGVGNSMLAVVTAKDSIQANGHGNSTIPLSAEGAVLSGHGTAGAFLNNSMFVGDTLTIDLALPPSADALTQLVGGGPRIIRNGVSSVEWVEESVGSSFAQDRHPRTAVGFSEDSTTVFFVTVDGRQGDYSVGMSLFELADYMLEWGIYQAVNLDGGGSTTMVVRGNVVNSPSDAGGERSVANALMAISKAPLGSLAYINLPWSETFTLVETQLQFSVYGTDQYFNPVTISDGSVQWSCDPTIGTISATGLLSASTTESEGYVYVSSGDIHDTTWVHVTDIATLSLQPAAVVLEPGESQVISAVSRDAFGNLIHVEPEAYTWWVSPDIATISATGVVQAESIGEGTITATFHEVTATIPLAIGSSTSVTIDSFDNTNNFTISGARINLAACSFTADNTQFVSAPTSGKLDYSLTTGGTSVLYLDCNIQISGTPESVSLQVYGDNSAHWIRGEFKNAQNEKFVLDFTTASPGIDWENEWREVTVMLEDAVPYWGNPNAILSFPLTWTKIYLAETDENNKDAGTIYLDDFKVNFIASDIDSPASISPQSFTLEEHYPNPFNSTTRFRFSIQEAGILELKLYSLDGREVDMVKQDARQGSLTLTWEADNLPSGVYLFKATLGNQELSGKCLLVK